MVSLDYNSIRTANNDNMGLQTSNFDIKEAKVPVVVAHCIATKQLLSAESVIVLCDFSLKFFDFTGVILTDAFA